MSWWQSVVVLGCAVIFLVGGGVWFYLRRKRSSKKAVSKSSGYLDALQGDFPEAFVVLSRFEESQGLATLGDEDPNVEKALSELEEYAASRQRSNKSEKASLSITGSDPSEVGRSGRPKAALVTIVRKIYSNPDHIRALGEGGQDALDSFLNSLLD